MKYLNLGCGSHFSDQPEWTNIDFVSNSPRVMAFNLLKGIPLESNSFDFAYHSHVLEHFSREDGVKFIAECFRVLKPGGILRVAIPNLEEIARKYLFHLEAGLNNSADVENHLSYEWMLLEMYDQTVRNQSGGNMGKCLRQEQLPNEKFIFERIGEEGMALRRNFLESLQHHSTGDSSGSGGSMIRKGKTIIKKGLFKMLGLDMRAYQIGTFRLGGEIHQWMYDRYSLRRLLEQSGGREIQIRGAFSSYLDKWESYGLDGRDGITRKPDSLFMEAIKK